MLWEYVMKGLGYFYVKTWMLIRYQPGEWGLGLGMVAERKEEYSKLRKHVWWP